ncbi:hypothetical protein VARIO8X_110096 [Burkholderiales bacterium 8X]|nr:hypothetical protein VARIO8X_110096 [Burkholderiales bacterium 8X]
MSAVMKRPRVWETGISQRALPGSSKLLPTKYWNASLANLWADASKLFCHPLRKTCSSGCSVLSTSNVAKPLGEIDVVPAKLLQSSEAEACCAGHSGNRR